MNLINNLEKNTQGNQRVAQKPTVSALIGKAWVKADKSFSIAPLTEPVQGKQGEFQISGVYPLILTEYTSVSFGLNKKRDEAKNQNTHWVFLKVEEDRMDEYKKLLAKIGQSTVSSVA